MKNLMSALVAVALSLSASAAFAGNAQQEKMKECNKQASEKSLKGKDRKAFMSECLKAGGGAAPAAAADAKKPLSPKEAMAACMKAIKDKGLKGDEMKKFKSDCLKAKGPDNMK
jgi:hypothetical protein